MQDYTLNQGGYDLVEYTKGQSFRSVQFPQLVLSVNTVLAPPVVEDLIREEQAQLRQAEQRADREQQRAEQLAAKLKEMGLDSDTL
ncbi:MAG: hypothetical protein GDA56_11025 [Hormoscilla sp. GM7CHS1pb]|nr:hypothetical protein [Hormoscilla sp. GM7CHS1pb]